MNDVVNSCKQSMEKRVKAFEGELLKIRTGRASISMLDGVKVDYYGAPTPLNQVATLATPDARTITISPFEKKMIQAIEKSIMVADLGLQPTNDGNIVRLPIPPLTEQRRKDIVKSLKKIGEDAKIAIRQARRDANDSLKKEKDLSEDDKKRLEGEIQKHTDQFVKVIDERMTKKEQEVMTL